MRQFIYVYCDSNCQGPKRQQIGGLKSPLCDLQPTDTTGLTESLLATAPLGQARQGRNKMGHGGSRVAVSTFSQRGFFSGSRIEWQFWLTTNARVAPKKYEFGHSVG
jgi:hypothetical protein